MEWFTVVLVLPLKNKKECVVDIGEEHGANQSVCVCVHVCLCGGGGGGVGIYACAYDQVKHKM